MYICRINLKTTAKMETKIKTNLPSHKISATIRDTGENVIIDVAARSMAEAIFLAKSKNKNMFNFFPSSKI